MTHDDAVRERANDMASEAIAVINALRGEVAKGYASPEVMDRACALIHRLSLPDTQGGLRERVQALRDQIDARKSKVLGHVNKPLTDEYTRGMVDGIVILAKNFYDAVDAALRDTEAP